jgi:hypothetical protein
MKVKPIRKWFIINRFGEPFPYQYWNSKADAARWRDEALPEDCDATIQEFELVPVKRKVRSK